MNKDKENSQKNSGFFNNNNNEKRMFNPTLIKTENINHNGNLNENDNDKSEYFNETDFLK